MKTEIIEAFKYPFKGEKYPKRFLLGCVVSLIPLFGNLAALGYVVKSMQGVLAGDEEVPRWEDLIGLFSWGIKAVGVMLIYGLAFMVPLSIGLFFILVIPHVIAVNIGFIFLVMSSILFLSSVFVIPMALIFMIKSGGSFHEALRFEDVLITIRDTASTYVVRSFFVWIIGLLFIAFMLLVISIKFGHLFVVVPIFYFLLIASYIFGMEGKTDPAGARRDGAKAE
jgi:hypothetical protein